MTRLHAVSIGIGALLAPSLSAATITVDLGGGADHTDIQAAIDAARDGDVVLVKPGEYVIAEPIDFNRNHDPALPESPPVKNLRVRSENGPDETVIRLAGDAAAASRASVVIFSKGESPDSVLEGFTITGGAGTELQGRTGRVGGGIFCSSNPTLRDCRIVGNTADSGGGIWCPARPAIVDCTLSDNSAVEGGGVYCPDDGPKLIGCAVIRNAGGGIVAVESRPELVDCVISRNAGPGVGSGYDARPVLRGCLISDNETVGVAGASGLSGCTISSNGIHGVDSGMSPVDLVNCVVEGNGGAGVACHQTCSDPDHWPIIGPNLMHCTIVGNSVGVRAGCFVGARLTNCIVWDNSEESLAVTAPEYGGFMRAEHSIIEGDEPWTGEGNLNQDPLFLRPGRWDDGGTPGDPADDAWVTGDYGLQPGSPAIDAGGPEGAPLTDIEGEVRPCGAGVDIGAHESGNCRPPVFRRGDSNSDGIADLSDAVSILGFLFLGTGTNDCPDAADVDDDGEVDISDPMRLLGHLFLGAGAPPEPFVDCGDDPTDDDLGCNTFDRCP